MKKSLVSIFIVLISVSIATLAESSVIFKVQGTVYDTQFTFPILPAGSGWSDQMTDFNNAFSIGDAVTMIYAFDQLTPSSIDFFSMTVGSYSATASGGVIQASDNWNGGDSYTVISEGLTGPSIGDWDLVSAGLSIYDASQSLFDGDIHPIMPEDLLPFCSGVHDVMSLGFSAPYNLDYNPPAYAGGYVKASIDSISIVPIPGSLLLLGSGLIGLVGVRRKFKNS